MSIGIFKTKNKVECATGTRVDKFGTDLGYGWIVNYRQLTSRTRYGTRECASGDIIEMILDFNKLTLSYTVNGDINNWGIAWKNIEQTSYRAVVSANQAGDGIQFLSYQESE